jgi:hypothetical protein
VGEDVIDDGGGAHWMAKTHDRFERKSRHHGSGEAVDQSVKGGGWTYDFWIRFDKSYKVMDNAS